MQQVDVDLVISRHERREAELEALYDAAGDLTRIRDVEGMLRATTERARRLLRCDVTYLSAAVHDRPGEEFAVRALSGQVSPRFLGTRVSVDRGVGGRVAATHRPFQVDDYGSAEDIVHTRYLDGQVGGEGICALLGVPLAVDGRLIGILFAGRRSTRTFDEDEVRLLSSLAGHAAVTLDNAAMFSAQNAALHDLEQTTEALRAHNLAIETAAQVHSRLADALLNGDGVGPILEVVRDALDVDIVMTDPAGHLVAGAGTAAGGPAPAVLPPYPLPVRRALDESRAAGRSVPVGGPDTAPGAVVRARTVAAGSSFLGSVVIASEVPLSETDVRTFELATQTIAAALLADAAMAAADERAAADTMRQLLGAGTTPSEVDALARRHLLAESDLVVMVADIAADTTGLDAQVVSAAVELCRRHGGLAARYEDQLVMIRPATEPGLSGRTWRELSHAGRTTVTLAASSPTRSLAALGRLHEETAACVRLMRQLGRDGTCACTDEFAMYSMLFAPGTERRLDLFLSSQVGLVLEYDRRHRTQLGDTALAYLDHGRSPRATSGALGVHVNTVTQRLSRIDRLLGPDWRTTRSLEMHTALRLCALRADS